MRKILFFITATFIFFSAKAQFTDDFSDGDFTQNPTWFGQTDSFIVNTSHQLQLNANVSGTSYLTTSSSVMDDIQWQFKVKLSFSPSANNNVTIYLCSDNADLSADLNGYFIKIGENLSEDGIDLWRKDGANTTKLIDGTAGTAASGGTFTIKVIRDNAGNWTLYSDPNGGDNFVPEGTVNDNTYQTTSYFGVFCKYTSSNTSKFYFDDFYVGNIIHDTIPPEIAQMYVPQNNKVHIDFTESVDPTTAQNTFNYQINNGIGNPDTVIFYQNNVDLIFSQTFTLGEYYQLNVANITDNEGNTMANYDTIFQYTKILPDFIVINEIMADPLPVHQLPGAEYIELYNTTSYTLNADTLFLKTGDVTKQIPSFTIAPDSYVLICDAEDTSLLSQFGDVLGIVNFQALNNSGQTLKIIDKDGVLINTVSYSDLWYNDEIKKDGGWSLEKIDPLNNCSGASNWTASIDELGGTPGRQNSVFASNIDTIPPQITQTITTGQNSLVIKFNEEIIYDSLISVNHYNLQGFNIVNIEALDNNKSVELFFDNNFTSPQDYTINITNLPDLCYNTLQNSNIEFNYYKTKRFDIVINEIMADATPQVYLPDAEYVEIFNRADYKVSMHNWTFRYGNYSATIPDCSIEPDSFIIICKNTVENLLKPYGRVVALSNFNLIASGLLISIEDAEGNVIHSVEYSQSWYKDDAKKDGGWSLEQIDPDNPCGDYDNWHASTSGTGGTPGKINSVYEQNPDLTAPAMLRATLTDSNKVEVWFDESILPDSLTNESFYVSPQNNTVTNISSINANNTALLLTFANNFSTGIIYNLHLKTAITDCAGNNIDTTQSVQFGFAVAPEKNDVIINEIMPYPKDGGVDYIEIYNRSNKVLDLYDLKLANKKDGEIDVIKNVSLSHILFFPGKYVLLSKSGRIVKSQYITKTNDNFIDMSSLPSYSSDEGTVVLLNLSNEIIDEAEYNESMHYPLLVSTKGVSLERINPNIPAYYDDNWHSAAESVGFGTPGYQNSQYNENTNQENEISLDKESFSPDNDGFDDVLGINYKFNKAGYTGSFYIFDSSGRLVKTLATNELLGTEGKYIWNGIDEYNNKVKIGAYILFVKVYDLEGNVKTYKKAFVVAGRIE